jgi:putative transposase
MPVEEKRTRIEPGHPPVSIRRPCTLLGLARSRLYSQPVPEGAANLQLMRLIDEQYPATPFDGIRRMTAWLRSQGCALHPKRVGRLLHHMGLEAIYPKPRLRQLAAGQEIYPDLLRGISLDRANQVWSADITYIRLQSGCVYLVAVRDWCSRDVLSWTPSITRDGYFCLEALDQALRQGQPAIFNTDQGAQFTSRDFTARLQKGGIRLRMDGCGRALDPAFVERLWRTVKYEEVYRRDYQTVGDARQGLGRYFAC